MTPEILLNRLRGMPVDAPLVFKTDEGPIGDGYHVTELKYARVTSIDCGTRVAEWTEAALQLLDGEGGGHMPVGKFAGIVSQSIGKVKGLANSPLHVEFAHENSGMRIYALGEPDFENGEVSVSLSESRAHCKPALDYAARNEGAACCGTGVTGSQCCQ
ncbi:MAG: hypothetical protein JJ866_23510 [Roseibium sp.]|uniref:DUF6428 family protein n=1 Tax=Roseibium sp. TaxID=1936156 RepID=UPI001B04FE69|nr:DUF6428 family protein [Roseibium sp.]MBO6509101.1 hypothetical protein [Roseibium sp.]MBO6894925.1 hypothetical protein [Roseibium sp.]MBO6930815.1 hypothetical protein [Roseibium sp.]